MKKTKKYEVKLVVRAARTDTGYIFVVEDEGGNLFDCDWNSTLERVERLAKKYNLPNGFFEEVRTL